MPERKVSEEEFAAFMAEHPNATYGEIKKAFDISQPTVSRYLRKWKERQAQHLNATPAPQPESDPLPIQPSPEPIEEPKPAMEKPASTPPAPYERTLYEEQVYQARLWMEMLERQRNDIWVHAEDVEKRYLQAKANYERAQQIARAHFAMLHGQVIEDVGEMS